MPAEPYLITLPAEPVMVRCARLAVGSLLGDDPRRQDAVLVVSEYFSNALLHSASGEGGTVRIRLAPGDEVLRIEVEDDGKRRTPIPPERADEGSQFGRGHTVVDGVAKSWGHDSNGRRGVSWAEI